jgi:beta-N-acetylhexosaminidase
MSPGILPLPSSRTTSRRRRGRRAVVAASGSALLLGGLLSGLGGGPANAGAAGTPAAVREAAASTTDPRGECASAVVSAMSEAQRVGQLFISGVNAAAPTAAERALVTTDRVGGVILTGRSSAGVTATRQVTDAMRALSGGAVTGGAALWVSTDQEGGFVQVLSGPGFSTIPTALSQGSLPTATLRADAAAWGRQLRAAGVDIDLAPVLDTVPASLGTQNKPIGFFAREYGHDPATVSASGNAFAAGLRDAGVRATAKHFPGLGRVIDNTDTTTGVTDTVTVRNDPYLQPFADAVHQGIALVMVSSAIYSRIDPTTIATFSPVVLGQMLRGDLGFGGIIVTDSLGAAALAPTPVGDRAVRFIQAGGTVALAAESDIVPAMVAGVLARAGTDATFRAAVDAAAQKVVAAKFDAGLITCPDAAGAIAEHYAQLGGTSSALGSPVSDVQPVAGGAVQFYRGGAIYWTPATGAHEVHGAIYVHYRALGGPAGVLGFPVTDERITGDGVGRYNHFGGVGGGSIFWTPTTGAHEVHGDIRQHWAQLSWERGPLGYPVTDTLVSPDRVGRYNHFNGSGGSAIYWSPTTGAHAIRGAIYLRWAQLGFELGSLGYPISDEFAISGGRREQDFQHGSLIWPFT